MSIEQAYKFIKRMEDDKEFEEGLGERLKKVNNMDEMINLINDEGFKCSEMDFQNAYIEYMEEIRPKWALPLFAFFIFMVYFLSDYSILHAVAFVTIFWIMTLNHRAYSRRPEREIGSEAIITVIKTGLFAFGFMFLASFVGVDVLHEDNIFHYVYEVIMPTATLWYIYAALGLNKLTFPRFYSGVYW